MLKSMIITCFGFVFLLLGGIQGWSVEDLEDHFINPDLIVSKDIFIDVKDVALVDVLKIISQQSGLSFIAAPDVADKKITLYINKVPFNQALPMVLDANDLTYEMQNNTNVFVVKAKYKTETTKITRVYQLKYATVSSSKLNSTLSTSDVGSSGTLSASSSGGTSSTSSSSVAGGGLEEAVKNALSADGKIIEDPRTNSLIITDVPGQFDIIESTIARLDVPVPQILIEVEMIDVSKNTADQMGITYGNGVTFTPITFTGGEKLVNYPFSRASTAGESTSNSSSNSGSTTNAYTPGIFNATGLDAELNFLASSSDSRTLARPRLLTLNNQTAQIEISQDQSVSEVVTQSGSPTSPLTGNSIERYTTGVILKVTPQANLETREITMALSPKVIDVVPSSLPITPEQGQIYDPVTRGSDSILRLKDGQSMIIGGLMREVTSSNSSKLPFLGDIPIIGAAFRANSKSKEERELIIFLTPHIIDDNDKKALADNSSSSVQETLDIQNASDRAQEINNVLNNFDTK